MSIVKMNKISLIGLERHKEMTLEKLMKMGVIEIENAQQKSSQDDWGGLLVKDCADGSVTEIENDIVRVGSAIEYITKYDTVKKGLFESRRTIEHDTYNGIVQNQSAIWEVVDEIAGYDEKLSSLRAEENRLKNQIVSLEPWEGLDVPIDFNSTKKTGAVIGVLPAISDMDDLRERMLQDVPESVLEHVGEDRDQIYLFVLFHKNAEEKVMDILKQSGFTRVTFKDMHGTAADNIKYSNNRIEEIEEERKGIEQKIRGLCHEREKLEVLYDFLQIRRDRKAAQNNIVKTEKTFMLEGWLPEELSEKVERELVSHWDCIVKISKPDEDEEYPIMLRNNKFADSVETITGMYSLPSSKEIDPNAVMAPFFIMFFGLMLSDAGYGLAIAAFSGLVLLKFKLEDSMKKFMKLALYCGLATVFWGTLFGSWFGDVVKIMGNNEKLMNPVWFNPVDDPERLLQWALLFGIVHIYVGISVKGISLIRQKKYLDSILDAFVWYVLFTGFAFIVLPYVPKISVEAVAPLVSSGKYLLIVGALLIILTQGRHQKNIIMKLLTGITGLYDLVGFLSDVLSYSRLLALGLATSVIATIINEMGAMLGLDNVLGILVFVLVFLFGHAFNLAINALGAYVHSSRLQYIEFFGRFYKGGGKAFKPFKINSKYIKFKA